MTGTLGGADAGPADRDGGRGGAQAPPPGRAPAALVRALHALERATPLDRAVRPLARLADRALRAPAVDAALRGTWLGHALHPLLTDFPLGAWIGATVLDLAGGPGARPAARRLVGFGVAAALPTAASGMAEWRACGPAPRRVGVVHAALNTAALGLYGASWLARRRGAHGRGVALGLLGGTAATAGGYLGGHLTLVRGVGTADAGFAPAPPEHPER